MKKTFIISLFIISIITGCKDNDKDIAKNYFKTLNDREVSYIEKNPTNETILKLTEIFIQDCFKNINNFEKNSIKGQLLLEKDKKGFPKTNTKIFVNKKIINLCKENNYYKDNSDLILDYKLIKEENENETKILTYEVELANNEKIEKNIYLVLDKTTNNLIIR